jgi:MFS family permease/predicted Ser/Thr protein kinase
MTDPLPLQPSDPVRIGAYALTGRLGEGGQGVVYTGRDPEGRQVAVKLLRGQFAGDAEARERFVRELAAAERVSGFCTARVLDAEMQGDQPYIVSEFVPGPSLQEFLQQAGPQRGDALVRLAIGTATALAAIHEAGVVHRDFKPPNVLMGPDGPRVIDFGIARALDTSASMTSQVIGTPAYMAPEQIAAQAVGPYTDMFAWGLTILFAATGTSPFAADSIPAVMHKVLYERADVSALPKPLAGLVNACLSKDPAGRPSATQVLLTLLGAVGAAPGPMPPAQALTQGAALAATQQVPVPPPAWAPWPPQPGIPTRPQPAQAAHSSGWAAIPAVVSAAITVGFVGNGFSFVLSFIQRDLHVASPTLRWVTVAYWLGLVALAFPASRVADRVGRKKVFVSAAAGLAFASVVAGFSANLGMLLGARTLQGLAAGLLMGASLAVLRAAFPADKVGMPIGVWGAATAAGLGVGPLLGAELAETLAWRWALLFPLVPGLLTLLLGAVLLRESRGLAAFPPVELLLAAALVLLSFGLDQGLSQGWLQVFTILPLVAGVVLGAVFAAAAKPVLGGLLGAPGVMAAVLLVGATSFGTAAIGLYASQALTIIQGQSWIAASATWVAWAFAAMIAAPVTGRLITAYEAQAQQKRLPILVGTLLTGISIIGMAAFGDNLILAFVWMMLAGAGFAMVLVAATAVMAEATPGPLAGVLGGLHTSVVSFGGTVAITALYSLLTALRPADDHSTYGTARSAMVIVLVVAACVVLASAVLAMFVRPAAAHARKTLPLGPEPQITADTNR